MVTGDMASLKGLELMIRKFWFCEHKISKLYLIFILCAPDRTAAINS